MVELVVVFDGRIVTDTEFEVVDVVLGRTVIVIEDDICIEAVCLGVGLTDEVILTDFVLLALILDEPVLDVEADSDGAYVEDFDTTCDFETFVETVVVLDFIFVTVTDWLLLAEAVLEPDFDVVELPVDDLLILPDIVYVTEALAELD